MSALGEELEETLTELNDYVTRTKNDTYQKITDILLSTLEIPFAIGYRKDYGWYVLLMTEDGPELHWSERKPRGT